MCILLLRFTPKFIRGDYKRRYAVSVFLAGCVGFFAMGECGYGSRAEASVIARVIGSALWRVGLYGGCTAVLVLLSNLFRSGPIMAPSEYPGSETLLDHRTESISADVTRSYVGHPACETPALTRSGSVSTDIEGPSTPIEEVTPFTHYQHLSSLKESRLKKTVSWDIGEWDTKLRQSIDSESNKDRQARWPEHQSRQQASAVIFDIERSHFSPTTRSHVCSTSIGVH